MRSRKKLDMADVIIYLYDSSDANSFSYLANIRVSLVMLLGNIAEGLSLVHVRQYRNNTRWIIYLACSSQPRRTST